MWNNIPNCSTSGSENNELESNSWMKEKIEKSLDLNHYLKYLDQLFSHGTSESDSSDSDDGERRTSFTEFRQPSVIFQSQDRFQLGPSQNNHLLLGPLESNNHLNNFTSVKPTDTFYTESNISSSSLSSVDSGAPPVSLNLLSENFLDQFHNKSDNSANGVTNSTDDKRTSVTGVEEETSEESNTEKQKKKVQKKKKSSKSSNETFSRHHKPSSGGKGSNGSKGGGGSGASGSGGGSGSNDNAGGSSGSSSNQNISGNNGSPGSKSRSDNQSLEKQTDSLTDIIMETEDNSRYDIDDNESSNFDSNDNSANLDLQRALGIRDSNVETFILNGDYVDNFEADESFPMNSILDNIREDETSISDFISVSTTLHSANSSPSSVSQRSTNFFGKIAEAVAATQSRTSHSICSGNISISDNTKFEVKRRKVENRKDPLENFSNLTEKQKQSKIELLNSKRRKIYVFISRKDVVKAQKTRASNFKEDLAMKRKLAHACARQVKKNAIQSQKCMKESICKAKRLTQEMEVYWKSVEKSERDLQRKLERESDGKLKKTLNTLNPTWDKKLFYLISQIECFVNKLLTECGIVNSDENSTAVNKVNELGNTNIQKSKELTFQSQVDSIISSAVNEHYSLVRLLDRSGSFRTSDKLKSGILQKSDAICDKSEKVLMEHQVSGMNWIGNLYKKGLNGILADESGLGKKAQAAGFLTTLIESYGLWGPFLIVSPTSSLVSWQQELCKICPKFKVLLYTGKQLEKKTLHQSWKKNDKVENSDFHVVITSYQVMTDDLKYFNKTDWQYLILDDSQNVITSGTKWMALLSFRCRNKLLLCGNPQMHSLQHICSYLYFVIPSLFDSHKELSEILLTGLESPLMDTSKPDENQSRTISRLYDVLQHFLLRRKLHDVEFEPERTHLNVGEELKCFLSKRQRNIYCDLLEKASLNTVGANLENCSPEELQKRVKIVLDLSLQLEKVCNHPDLIEEPCYFTSPLWIAGSYIAIPYLIYQILPFKMDDQALFRLFCIYNSFKVYTSLFGKPLTKYTNDVFTTWGFVRLLKLSWVEMEDLFLGRNAGRLNYLVKIQSVLERIQYNTVWMESQKSAYLFYYPTALMYNLLSKSKILSMLVFTSSCSGGSWKKCKPLSMINTIQQRTLKSKNHFRKIMDVNSSADCFNKEFSLPSLEYPDVLRCYSSAVHSEGFKPFISTKRHYQQVATMGNWGTVSKVMNITGVHRLPNTTFNPNFQDSQTTFNWPQRFLFEHGSFIGDSGKMVILDSFLTYVKKSRRVLLVSFKRENVLLLEEFLKIRKLKYTQVTDDVYQKDLINDIFVYLMHAYEPLKKNVELSFKTVVFYDHDWNFKYEDQKNTLMKKFENQQDVDYYSIICTRTIEERMTEFIEERNILSQSMSEGIKNKRVSVIATLKCLVSIVMHGYKQQKEENEFGSCETVMGYPTDEYYENDLNVHTYSRKSCSLEDVDTMDFVNHNEEFESASPSCSEEQEVYIYEDGEREVSKCRDDHFNLNFDEGYMGMSPDSFEDVSVKSGYEKHNLTKTPKLERGAGKRGRPPSRVRFTRRDPYDGSEMTRRGPGRPRLKTVGPANQGTRGRKPGRPPLTRRVETISSCLNSLSSGQNVFGFYSTPDVTLS